MRRPPRCRHQPIQMLVLLFIAGTQEFLALEGHRVNQILFWFFVGAGIAAGVWWVKHHKCESKVEHS